MVKDKRLGYSERENMIAALTVNALEALGIDSATKRAMFTSKPLLHLSFDPFGLAAKDILHLALFNPAELKGMLRFPGEDS